MISKPPKPLIGYSDITALHTALGEKAGIVTIHAPMLFNFADEKKMTAYTKSQFLTGLTEKNAVGEILLPRNGKLKTLVEGEAEGIIVGGNLAVLTSLVGTPYELDGTGALLLLEDVDERPYRLDRMLYQLYQNGLLNRVNGILFGDFTDCKNKKPGGLTFEEVLEHYAKLSGKPAVMGVPAGHEKNNMFLPMGVHAKMTADSNGKARLIIDESAFKS
ncbi:MAG: LD-carboxypeptidase [Selenomonadaceae bacterium]|nr:LD-carboxypeptidase [Selenomonadaceae bacterium]